MISKELKCGKKEKREKILGLGLVSVTLIAVTMAMAFLTGWWYGIIEWFGEWAGARLDSWFSSRLE